MAYYVVGDDGQKYGPADVETLNSWIAENRLVRTQVLEDEESGQRMAASAVKGLNFPVASGPAPGAAPAGPLPGSPGYLGTYARPGGYVADDGAGDVKVAWIMAGIGVFFGIGFCLVFPLFITIVLSIIGIVFAGKAGAKGHAGATAPKVCNIVLLILSLVWVGFIGVRAAQLMQNPAFQRQIQQIQSGQRPGATNQQSLPQPTR